MKDQQDSSTVEMKNYEMLAARITALGAMCRKSNDITLYCIQEASDSTQEIVALSQVVKIDPVLLSGVVIFCHDIMVSLERIQNMWENKEDTPWKQLIEKMSKVTPLLTMIGGGKTYISVCEISEKYQVGTIIGKEAVTHENLTNKVLHKLFEEIINLITFFCKNAQQEDEFSKSCNEVS